MKFTNWFGAANIVRCTVVAAALLSMALTCNPPSAPEDPNIIKLSLESEGRTTATFSGALIKAIIETNDSVNFDDINWHCGGGIVHRPPDIAPGRMIVRDSVMLEWAKIPTLKDTAQGEHHNQYYDTVYVTTGGGLHSSNTVRVYVTNLKPEFDSLVVGDTTINTVDTMPFTVDLRTNTTSVNMRMYAHDPEAQLLQVDWTSMHGKVFYNIGASTQAIYTPPAGQNFRDTVVVTVIDGKGGRFIRTVFLTRTRPNTPPVIDSIRIDTSVYAASRTLWDYATVIVDTIRLRVYGHDAENDAFSFSWRAKSDPTRLANKGGTNNNYIEYQWCTNAAGAGCDTTLLHPVTGAMRVIDTLIVTATDTLSDSTSRIIPIFQGTINRAPSIDSLGVDTALLKGSRPFSFRCPADDSVVFRAFAHDPDLGDSIIYRWTVSGILAHLSGSAGDTTILACRHTAGSDTVKLAINDRSGHRDSVVTIVTINNTAPVIDSLRADSTVLKGTRPWTLHHTALDTMRLRASAHDPDAGDTVGYQWSISGTEGKLTSTVGDSTKYVYRHTLGTDTVKLVANDRYNHLDSVLTLIVINNIIPVLDSVTVTPAVGTPQTILFAQPDSVVSDTGAHLSLQAYVTEPDAADQLVYKWSSRKSGRLVPNATNPFRAIYTALNSKYTDTCTVIVTDSHATSDTGMFRIVVDTTMP